MNHKKIVVANWKMNLPGEAAVELAKKIKTALARVKSGPDVVLCPAFTELTAVKKAIEKSAIQLGAQDVFWREKGAFTGEVSPSMLKSAGCRYVIIGHSERRRLGETDEMVNQKMAAALEAGLAPIVCIGETLDEKIAGQTEVVIHRQLARALHELNLTRDEEMLIAYEPVWAIGTGQVIAPADAADAFALIRQILIDHFPKSIALRVRLLYGGSVDNGNAADFSGLELLSGFLVGGASLDADKFLGIVNVLK